MTENERIKNIRKDYHLYTYINNYTLKEGKKDSRKYVNRKNNRTDNWQGYMEIQLTAEEASRYDRNKIMLILKKYTEIIKNRSQYMTKELLLYAIEQCIFGDEKWIYLTSIGQRHV